MSPTTVFDVQCKLLQKIQRTSSPYRPVSGVKLPEKPIFIGVKCSHPDFREDREIRRDVQSHDWTVNQPDVGWYRLQDLVPEKDFLLSGCALRDHRETLIEGEIVLSNGENRTLSTLGNAPNASSMCERFFFL
jgi:hypothetical protein